MDIKRLEGQSEYRTQFNLPQLIPGIYTLALQTAHEWQTLGLIIQK